MPCVSLNFPYNNLDTHTHVILGSLQHHVMYSGPGDAHASLTGRKTVD